MDDLIERMAEAHHNASLAVEAQLECTWEVLSTKARKPKIEAMRAAWAVAADLTAELESKNMAQAKLLERCYRVIDGIDDYGEEIRRLQKILKMDISELVVHEVATKES